MFVSHSNAQPQPSHRPTWRGATPLWTFEAAASRTFLFWRALPDPITTIPGSTTIQVFRTHCVTDCTRLGSGEAAPGMRTLYWWRNWEGSPRATYHAISATTPAQAVSASSALVRTRVTGA